jgi:hypothetical protein
LTVKVKTALLQTDVLSLLITLLDPFSRLPATIRIDGRQEAKAGKR